MALRDEGVGAEQGRAFPSREQLSKEPCAPWQETLDKNKGEQGPGSSQHRHKTSWSPLPPTRQQQLKAVKWGQDQPTWPQPGPA